MPPKNWLLAKVKEDFTQFNFAPGELFWWSPRENTIYYPKDTYTDHELLHELGHALLDHTDYTQDIELLRMETEAWHYAVTSLAPRYNIAISQNIVEELLDTYRNWLHARSMCAACGHNSPQTKTGIYQCLNCRCQWRANQARVCALRRYALN